jgi:hypothetical protein
MEVSAIAMPFELWFGKIGDEMVVEPTGGFEVVTAAMRTLLGMHLVLDERCPGRWFRAEDTWMLAMLLEAVIVGRALPWRALLLATFAALQERLHLMFEQGDPLAQRGVLGAEFGILGFENGYSLHEGLLPVLALLNGVHAESLSNGFARSCASFPAFLQFPRDDAGKSKSPQGTPTRWLRVPRA